ncbi:hypothetical protein B0H19DRAFT_1202429, partial [Mycena capillaripes]
MRSFAAMVDPATACSRAGEYVHRVAVWCLASLVSTVSSAELQGKSASLYAFFWWVRGELLDLRIKGDMSEISETMDLLSWLKKMKVVPCQEFVDGLEISGRRTTTP